MPGRWRRRSRARLSPSRRLPIRSTRKRQPARRAAQASRGHNRISWADFDLKGCLELRLDGGFRPQLGRSATHRAIPKPDVQHRSGAAASRPWSPFSKVARLLQTGRTIEDPYGLVWIAVVRSQACGRPAMREKRSFVGGAAASQTDSVRTRRVVPISVNLVRLAALVTPDSATGRADYPHR
jgi:hypothetical protein